MAKAGTRNYLSISQGVRDLESNESVASISACTDAFVDSLEAYRTALAAGTDDDMLPLSDALEKEVGRYQGELLRHEKSLNRSIKLLSAKVDKGIEWELDLMYQYQNINDEFDLMIRAIVMDLLYQGRFEESETVLGPRLKRDADFEKLVAHFRSLRAMMKALYDEDYSLVLEWVLAHEREIAKVSELKSQLLRLIYHQARVIIADRTVPVPAHGNVLLDVREQEDSRIMLRILDYDNQQKYAEAQGLYCWDLPTLGEFDSEKEQAKDAAVAELIRVYNRLSCEVNHLQQESPLHRCLLAGHFALGVLVKYNTLSRRKSSSSLGTAGSGSALGSGAASGPLSGSGSAPGSTVLDPFSRRRSIATATDMHPLISRIREMHTHYNTDEGGPMDDGGAPATAAAVAADAAFSSACDVDPSDNNVGELPMEIELPAWMGYHTIFICPILKEETTSSNRPHVLPCRHFISKQALSKLAKGLSDEIKCPYCPRRGSWRGACEVKFIAI